MAWRRRGRPSREGISMYKVFLPWRKQHETCKPSLPKEQPSDVKKRDRFLFSFACPGGPSSVSWLILNRLFSFRVWTLPDRLELSGSWPLTVCAHA